MASRMASMRRALGSWKYRALRLNVSVTYPSVPGSDLQVGNDLAAAPLWSTSAASVPM